MESLNVDRPIITYLKPQLLFHVSCGVTLWRPDKHTPRMLCGEPQGERRRERETQGKRDRERETQEERDAARERQGEMEEMKQRKRMTLKN